MIWEIDGDTKGNREIVNAKLVNDCLEWDFVLGNNSQFCAIFLLDGVIDNLESLKKKEIRPILYHKDLRNYHKTNMDCKGIFGYRLYPAKMRGDTLFIGNQYEGNTIWIKPPKLNVKIVCSNPKKVGLFFFRGQSFKIVKLKLTEDDINHPVYYRRKTQGEDFLYSFIFTTELVSINVMDGDKIVFYKDPQCTKILEVEGI